MISLLCQSEWHSLGDSANNRTYTFFCKYVRFELHLKFFAGFGFEFKRSLLRISEVCWPLSSLYGASADNRREWNGNTECQLLRQIRTRLAFYQSCQRFLIIWLIIPRLLTRP